MEDSRKLFLEQCEPDSGNSFFYLSASVKSFPPKKKRLFVRMHPDLAERLIHAFDKSTKGWDPELARFYVQEYKESLDRHHTAYFVSESLGKPISRRNHSARLETPRHIAEKDIVFVLNRNLQRAMSHERANHCLVNGNRPDYL